MGIFSQKQRSIWRGYICLMAMHKPLEGKLQCNARTYDAESPRWWMTSESPPRMSTTVPLR